MTNAHPHKNWLLAAMSACLALSFLDMTAVSISLPQIQKLLNGSSVGLQWVVNAYLLTLAILIVPGGRLGDMYNHKQIFLLGAGLFLIASILCASASSLPWLIAARILQGAGGALLVPNSSVIILHAFPIEERGKAMGLYVGVASVFLAFGPLIGGILTQLVSWRLVFWINIPLLVFSMTIVSIILTATKNPQKPVFDWQGFILFSIAVTTLIVALMQIATLGFQSLTMWVLLLISSISVYFFIRIEKRHLQPLLDLTLFNNKAFLACALFLFCTQITLISGIFRGIWMQDVLGYTPMMAGLLALPGVLPILLMAPLAGRLLDKQGTRYPVKYGFLLAALGGLWITVFCFWQNYWLILPGLFISGCGLPLIINPINTTALSVTASQQRGAASGTLNALRQLGGTFGLGGLTAAVTTTNVNLLQTHLTQSAISLSAIRLEGLLAGSPKAQNAIAYLSPLQRSEIYSAAKSAYTVAFSFSCFVALAFLILGYWLFSKLMR